jgi:hypothetical protein
MKPEKQQLLHDLLGDDRCREATLLAGAQVLRQRRQYRAATRILALLLVLSITGICLEREYLHRPSTPALAQHSIAAVSTSAPKPEAISDDQLLALFPQTPVGLLTLSDGHKRLVFPHPGDEQKFLTRL